ncbi:MAG: hypothetical protein H6754_09010 [Candidatus Omnitrophica bacterium]|nr:hypothetical protein [Candidatus Omnitrophota bacterium]
MQRSFILKIFLVLCWLCGTIVQSSSLEASDNLAADVEAMKVQMENVQREHNEMIRKMQERIEILEKQKETRISEIENKEEFKREIIRDKRAESAVGTRSDLFSKQVGFGTVRLMDISFDSLFTAGGSTANDSGIDLLQAGAHDPKKRGFTVQNLEFSMQGAIDPYINGEAHIIYQIDKDGESSLEVEEVFLTTQTLPFDLQVKAGTYFTEFGRLNTQHPHSWDFVDQPIVNSRMFGGDGLRGPGARLSWLAPLPWYSEVFGGVQNANGETAFSFLYVAGEDFAGNTLIARDVQSTKDLLYSTRWLNSVDLSEELTLNLGASSLWGPNSSATETQTRIYGTDIYLKWKPVVNENGSHFVSWQTELIKRDYEAGEDKIKLKDSGIYTQMLWGFKQNWVAGLRYDLADGNGEATDYLRDRRDRVSSNLTWYPTEFSKIRLQYSYDRAEHINEDRDGDEHSLWLQYGFNMNLY